LYVTANRFYHFDRRSYLHHLRRGIYFFFIARGLQKIDEDVPGSSWGFRVIIIPGCILLWPPLLNKWRYSTKTD
jgi:hypothetical protein